MPSWQSRRQRWCVAVARGGDTLLSHSAFASADQRPPNLQMATAGKRTHVVMPDYGEYIRTYKMWVTFN